MTPTERTVILVTARNAPETRRALREEYERRMSATRAAHREGREAVWPSWPALADAWTCTLTDHRGITLAAGGSSERVAIQRACGALLAVERARGLR